MRDLEVAFFFRLILPDLMTNVAKIYQIGLYMLCGIGRDFDPSLWPGGRAFELSCCPGVRDI